MLITECRTTKEKQQFAIQYHGIECQQRKLVEEVHELNEAVTRYETKRDNGLMANTEEILTEVADVKNLLEQIIYKYCLDSIAVNDEKKRKIERHFKEMEAEINARKISD